MSVKHVYITKTSCYFPNEPVSNAEMEEYLGYLNGSPSRSKAIVLRNNGIKRRFYALTREGKITHTNAQMTALSVRNLFHNPEELATIQLLSCGTSTPDQMMPSHAVMVHGWLPEMESVEVVSSAGVCCAGMHALKYAFMAIRTGEVTQAVATGSDRVSASLISNNFSEEVHKLKELSQDPYIGFEKEFLRWMLSDGASAFLMSDQPNPDGLSLRIDWMEGFSYANRFDPCMYMGADKNKDGSITSYLDYSPQEMVEKSIFSIKQDVKLLSQNIVELGGVGLSKALEKHQVRSADIDYFLPHLSSGFFKDKVHDRLIENGTPIPYEKWFINLPEVGNVGAASAYLMVDELFRSGRLKQGEKILLLVPESGRFSYMYVMMTVC
jgi:3-oxoacyl-[acyl-carrier-protein] synthase-3